jgi:outer membrane lipoprotein
MKNKIIKLLQAVALLSLATGCAAPMIPKTVMSGVSQPPVAFKEILKNTDNYAGKTVLWGGEIIRLTNDKDMTTIEVLQAPTDSDGKPESVENSQGRFLAEVKEYLDAEVYKKGRQISVVGKVQGKREQPLETGKADYSYPLIAVDHLYLWPKPEMYNSSPAYYYGYPYGWWDWNWGWGPAYYGPGWGFGFHYGGPFYWEDDWY